VRFRIAGAAAFAVAWAAGVFFLWQTSVPDLDLPRVDLGRYFTRAELHEASHYDEIARLLSLGGTAAQIVALALFALYGARFTRESAAGPIGTGMLLGMLGFALVWAAQLPFEVLTVWWRRRHGLSGDYAQATVGNWLALGGTFVFLCLALAIVMGLARKLGERWWLPAAPCFIGLATLFAFTFPWLLGGHRIGDPQLRASAQRLAHVEHVDDVPVRVLDGFDEPNAFATGLGPSRRVFLWEPILEPPFSADEVEVVIAHELGHLAHEHIWKSLGLYALLAFPGTWLIMRLTRRRGGMGEPTAVPLAVLVFVVLGLAAQPFENVFTRRLEAEADWSALQATKDPRAATELFEGFVDTTLTDPDPPLWDYLLLETHPTLEQRIAMAEAWRRRYAASDAQSP
jgi:Zn-dependent protease with chaperone function